LELEVYKQAAESSDDEEFRRLVAEICMVDAKLSKALDEDFRRLEIEYYRVAAGCSQDQEFRRRVAEFCDADAKLREAKARQAEEEQQEWQTVADDREVNANPTFPAFRQNPLASLLESLEAPKYDDVNFKLLELFEAIEQGDPNAEDELYELLESIKRDLAAASADRDRQIRRLENVLCEAEAEQRELEQLLRSEVELRKLEAARYQRRRSAK
jgi:hypothetical protein